MTIDPTAFIHPTAVVDDGAIVGANTKIWHFSHVCAGATIGANVVLGQNTYVAPTVRIGDGCRVQNNVSLYDAVVLEEDVFVGPSAVFTNVRTPRAHVSRKDAYEETLLRKGSSIGANVTIVCGVELGSYAMIGAGSVITRSIEPFSLVAGNPSRTLGWVCQCGARLPRQQQTRMICTRCDAQYMLMDDELFWLNES